MFDKMKTTLFVETPIKKELDKVTPSSFVNAGLMKAAEGRSGNNALKYTTTGNDFVDQFSKAGTFRNPRTFDAISKDMNLLWTQSPELAVRFTLYLRIITRTVQFMDGSKSNNVARGTGLKHESLMRMLWIYSRDPKVFWNNINLFVSIGSWRDVFELLRYDLQYHGWDGRFLNWDKMLDVISLGIENEVAMNLIKKYLPQIKSRSKCTTIETQSNTIIGKWLSSKWNLTYKQYRLLKTSGTAHEWQKVISNKDWSKLNFGSIHGRALALLISGKFLDNQNLNDKYIEWLMKQPTVKYTGYPHELMATVTNKMKLAQRITVDKQFLGLVATGKKDALDASSFIVVRDTSGSMGSTANGTNMASGDIAKAIALYFSYFLTGKFANSYIEFNSQSRMINWKGNNPTDKWLNDKGSYNGSTNFQDVIDLFVRIKAEGVTESEFPTGIICISDGNFDPAMLGKTNLKVLRYKLLYAGFSEDYVSKFKIVLWDIPNGFYSRRGTPAVQFETFGETENVFYLSGYDASILAFLTGIKVVDKETGKVVISDAPKTDVELFESAMNQEILDYVVI